MRCTPVGEWHTRRGQYQPRTEQRALPKRPVADSGEQGKAPCGDAFHGGPAARPRHTYSKSYDVAFIFEALHRKRYVDENGKRIAARRLTSEQVRIPDTVVYKGGFPAQWYFHSKADGRFMKKKPQSLVIPKIFEAFGAENGSCDTQVVATFIGTIATPDGHVNQVIYFDRARLKDFLYAENIMKDGFLQRFIAPTVIPFDTAARNSTLHAIWSRYACMVELRVNKIKLDNPHHSVVQKVNCTATRADCQAINPHTRLQRNIEEMCEAMCKHIQATSSDKAEVTNMNAYFKIGEGNKLWMLFASSVTVAPKFQDAYGYIPSLRTFTGRHSPILSCPDFIFDKDEEQTAVKPKANCSMCNVSHTEDEKSCAYAITFKMLAAYIEEQREILLEDMKRSAVVEVNVSQSPLNKRRSFLEDSDINNKATALFTILGWGGGRREETDTNKDNQILLVQLWAGLTDLGYRVNEISTILRLEHKMLQIKTELHEQDTLDAEGGGREGSVLQADPAHIDTFKKPGSGASRAGVLSASSTGVDPGSDSGENEGRKDCERSAEAENLEDPEGGNGRLSDFASEKSPTGELEEEAAQGRDLILKVKKFFPVVSVDDFRLGVQEAVAKMSEARRDRFAANIDMMGEAPEELENLFNDSTATAENGDDTNKGKPDFAAQAARRASLLSKQLPPFLVHIKKKLPAQHLRRIVLSETITDDFGNKRIWVCKNCASQYNGTAGKTFEWSDAVSNKELSDKQEKSLNMLKVIQAKSNLEKDFYPFGEIPAECTPRMYDALHEHSERAFSIGPPQRTAGGVRDLLAEAHRRRTKLPHEYRKVNGPSLMQIELKDSHKEPDMTRLMERLGLTPRRHVRGTLNIGAGEQPRAQTSSTSWSQKSPKRRLQENLNPPKTAVLGARGWPKAQLSHERLTDTERALSQQKQMRPQLPTTTAPRPSSMKSSGDRSSTNVLMWLDSAESTGG